jgi:hypothetical protein
MSLYLGTQPWYFCTIPPPTAYAYHTVLMFALANANVSTTRTQRLDSVVAAAA